MEQDCADLNTGDKQEFVQETCCLNAELETNVRAAEPSLKLNGTQLENHFKSLNGPLVWGLTTFREPKLSRQISRLKDLLLIQCTAFDSVCIHFCLCWLHLKRGEPHKSREHLVKIDIIIQTVDWLPNGEALLLKHCLSAVQHALYASWVHLAAEISSLLEMQPELESIISPNIFDEQQKAAMHGLEASCRHYFFGWIGLRTRAAGLRAQELDTEELEWQLLIGNTESIANRIHEMPDDTLTPSIAIQCILWFAQKNRDDDAHAMLSRALKTWPKNAYVVLYAAYLYGHTKSTFHDHELAIFYSDMALDLAPDCIVVHVVKRMISESHFSHLLSLCEDTYGKKLNSLLQYFRSGVFSFHIIMRGFHLR